MPKNSQPAKVGAGRDEGVGSSVAEEPTPTFVESVTPSGLEIRYTWAPKRKYEIRGQGEFLELAKGYGAWREVPSVTTVLDVLNKPGLPWWGMKIGVQGVAQLISDGVVHEKDFARVPGGTVVDVDGLVQLLTAKKLTVNHQRDKAGDRGIVVHDALETWAKTGHLPDPNMYDEAESGYVKGLLKFLKDVDPVPEACEVMVGSLEHGYAGRYDVRLSTHLKCNVVYKRTPKRGDHWAVLKPGTILADLKTSSGVYPSHELQLAAYEQASIECGYGPTDGRGIIHVTPDGYYEFFRVRAVPEDFLAVLSAHNAIEKFKKKDR